MELNGQALLDFIQKATRVTGGTKATGVRIQQTDGHCMFGFMGRGAAACGYKLQRLMRQHKIVFSIANKRGSEFIMSPTSAEALVKVVMDLPETVLEFKPAAKSLEV